jgi:hypothetical protein
MTTLGHVRSAQGRLEEAEKLFRESLALLEGTCFHLLVVAAIVPLADFLRAHDRTAEAAELEARLPDPVPGWLGREDARIPASASA